MSDEFNKISRPFDYVGDNGITYMFNPWSTKPTEPAYQKYQSFNLLIK